LLKAFPATHRSIAKKIQCHNRETEESTWLADHRNNLLDKNQETTRKSETTDPLMLNDHVKNPNRNNSQKNLHKFGRAELTSSRA